MVQPSSSAPLPLPAPRRAIENVPATLQDVDWIDDLQKRHRDRVGWHPRWALGGRLPASSERNERVPANAA